MSFATPSLLFFLVLPLALLIWVWRRHSRRLVLPFDYSQVGSGWGWRWLLNAAECLPVLLLAVVIVILAGPQQLSEPKTKRVMTNIEFAVDVSGSMTAEFGDGTRYDTSMKSINEFLDFRKGDAFGLTFFGNNVLHWVPLTNDISAIRCAPPFMRPEIAPPWMGGTAIGLALRECKKVLTKREEGDRMIVLVTDGQSFDLSGGNDEKIAKELSAENITVFAILVGGEAVPEEVANICSLTNGGSFQAGDPEALKVIFKRIDEMKQTKLEKTYSETMDDFWPYCLAGAILASCSLLSSFGLRYTPW